ncbi:NAD(P)-dependent malic enzyme [Corynebacterium ulceribovis]|uniref:NAD(P)-dependent malic enzyme n=1 Tax=Corynebacterium ulceribovis TaxID=487732 RepID=UPI000381B201|nr:NADP-dependent malic enzyme [Corynebacterium ulceribovis]
MTNNLPAGITDEEIFSAHRGGKLEVSSKLSLESKRDLSVSYTPGVARVCSAIQDDPDLVRELTWAGRNVAIISDGSAVLGLGNIGPAGALPVMEGKAQLFKTFGDLNAVPIVLGTQDLEELVQVITALAPSFGAINLEDISAPRCFELEERLTSTLDIPLMHDDQHGTAVVTTAGLVNACKLTDRALGDLRVVISGAGAAGVAITRMLLKAGVQDITVLDSRGIIHKDRSPLNEVKQELAQLTNPRNLHGDAGVALRGADVFIGVSAGTITEQQLSGMAPEPILFSLANPDPEIPYALAEKYGRVIATGRSDLPNQINNVLAFPGIFRGALDSGARRITPSMMLAAAEAIAGIVGDQLATDYIVPSPLDDRVAGTVAAAVAKAAKLDPAAKVRVAEK